jgi:hypothetical protein
MAGDLVTDGLPQPPPGSFRVNRMGLFLLWFLIMSKTLEISERANNRFRVLKPEVLV